MPNRGNGEVLSAPAAPTRNPQLPLPADYQHMDFHRDGYLTERSSLAHHASSSASASAHPNILPPNPPPPMAIASTRRLHHRMAARGLPHSDQESDEDLGSSADEEEQVLRYIDEFDVTPLHVRSLMAEDNVRAAQLLRGQVPAKRIASKKALSQLQSVDMSTLSESERSESLFCRFVLLPTFYPLARAVLEIC